VVLEHALLDVGVGFPADARDAFIEFSRVPPRSSPVNLLPPAPSWALPTAATCAARSTSSCTVDCCDNFTMAENWARSIFQRSSSVVPLGK
jgi:hypothetical protein